MRKLNLIQIGLCGSLFAVAAFAQAGGPKTAPTDPTPPSPEQKPVATKPAEAKPTAAEAAAALKTKNAEFTQLDTDKDGFVTKKEAGVHPQLLTDFAKLDSDKDGKLSLAEYEKHH